MNKIYVQKQGSVQPLLPKMSKRLTNCNKVLDLSSLIGLYLGQIEGKKPTQISAEELIAKLKDDEDLTINLGADEIFNQVVRHMFFDKDGKIRPINLRILSQIPCSETKDADYR